jgi:hypothetical protein
VREFMDGHLIPLHKLKEGLFFLGPHKSISHYDYTNVFHAIDTEFRYENHIILFEREGASEELFEKVYSNLYSPESFLWFSQSSFSFPAIDFHRYPETTLIGDTGVRSNSQGIYICADRWADIKYKDIPILSEINLIQKFF